MPVKRLQTLRSSSISPYVEYYCNRHESSSMLHRYNYHYGDRVEALAHSGDDPPNDPCRVRLWLQRNGNHRPPQRDGLSRAAAFGAGGSDLLSVGSSVDSGRGAAAAPEVLQAPALRPDHPVGVVK